MSDIYTRTPVNKSAAVVTSQSGCVDELTREQERENLVLKIKALEPQILALPKKSKERKALAKKKFEIQNKITEYSDVAISNSNTLADYILQVVKDRVTKPEWEIILKKARQMEADRSIENE